MITGRDLSYAYGTRRRSTPVLTGVDVDARAGRVLGLIGPNGSGKTTLLRLLHAALRSPTGRVEVDGETVVDLGPREAARRLAVVVQEHGGESTMTVGEMVLLGRTPHLGTFQRTGDADHEAATDALRRVGADHLGPRAFAGLSGGERQRVLIARALAQEATHLLLDEPTNHLDVRYQHEVMTLVRDLATTSVVVLHDLALAARYCDDVVLLGGGRVVASGEAADVLTPEVLEPVYGIRVRQLVVDGETHLLLRPQPTQPTQPTPTPAGGTR
ncbi:ABC transporter ATP-binding protein [Nocardioides sp. AX2bis]|uniref:ABC transporter ATP-binding protein n=1 Tax=Nocardioides sp. AX2bis TaxID=2653157 RepID=UPI0012EF1FAB|nr:ABC transporter ATP-binding protein [Nocardioides sp. AX2bis]VXA96171.1 Histidinol phosphatase [Nocardioides sp. AX2bis]